MESESYVELASLSCNRYEKIKAPIVTINLFSKFLLITLHLVGLFLAIFAPNDVKNPDMPFEFHLVRWLYLANSLLGCIIATIYSIFTVLALVKVVHQSMYTNMPMMICMLITDLVWVISTLIIAILCILREDSVSDINYHKVVVRPGFFLIAAIIGFIGVVCYGVSILIEVWIIRKYCKKPIAS